MNVNCDNIDGKCSQCGKPAVACVRTCRAVVPLPTAPPRLHHGPAAGAATEKVFFSSLPCPHRGDSRSVRCGDCGGAWVSVADCALLGESCTVDGRTVNKVTTINCAKCKFKPAAAG